MDDADISDRTNSSAAFAFLAEMERRRDSEEPSDQHNRRDDDEAMDTDAKDSCGDKLLFKRQSNSSKEWRKPSFNKSVSLRKQIEHTDTGSAANTSDEKPSLRGSKVVMPEYVIGQKVANSNKAKKTNLNISCGSSQASDTKPSKQQNQKPLLQHLFDEEGEDEEDI